jgi:hypothetical protein
LGRALSPAKLIEIELNEESKTATVLVSDDQVSLAIGKQGQNVRLASRLTGYQINLVKEARDEEDIELIDFREEIGAELYNELIRSRIDTAKEFLSAPRETLLRIPGMTPERLEEIRRILEREFAQADELLESSAEKAGVSLTTLRPGQTADLEEIAQQTAAANIETTDGEAVNGDERSSTTEAATVEESVNNG